jgi:protein SCO1/2
MKQALVCVFTFAATLTAAAVVDQSKVPAQLRGITIEQRLGAPLPLDSRFQDETGQTVPLSAYFNKRPVLLALVYYRCPMLCSRVLSGVVAALRPLKLQPGRDFDVVAISFDPSETPAEAAQKRDQYTRQYSGHAGSPGWHFLVGSPESIKAVTDAVGFHYRWDPSSNMYIHASGIMMATPEGKLSRYFYGIEYEPKDLKLGLIESSHNKIGSLADMVLLFCCQYDPTTGKYTAAVLNLVRVGGVLILLAMGAGFWWLSRKGPATAGALPV